jgi:hypothetical protein
VRIKTFNEYSDQYSNDISTFVNKIAIATNEGLDFPFFNYVSNKFELNETLGWMPIIMSEGFTFDTTTVNESYFTYNMSKTPDIEEVYEHFSNAVFVPKLTREFSRLKKMKFPVTAYSKNGSQDFKTLNKLRASEGIYEKFRENPVPKTKFKVLSFKGEPVSIVETINKMPLDVDLKRFSYLKEVKEISKSLYEKYDLDFYNVELIESTKGGLFINGVNKNLNMNPHQSLKVYETVYEDYYETRIPNWVKDRMLNEGVSKYYTNKAYDSMLIRSNHTMDY